jgi:hypothetical protein
METLIVHPKNKAQQEAAMAFFSAMKMPYEVEKESAESTYSPEFNAKMERAEADLEAGRYKAIKTADLWK